MWDLIVSVPDHCLYFYFTVNFCNDIDLSRGFKMCKWPFGYSVSPGKSKIRQRGRIRQPLQNSATLRMHQTFPAIYDVGKTTSGEVGIP